MNETEKLSRMANRRKLNDIAVTSVF